MLIKWCLETNNLFGCSKLVFASVVNIPLQVNFVNRGPRALQNKRILDDIRVLDDDIGALDDNRLLDDNGVLKDIGVLDNNEVLDSKFGF